MAAASTNLGRNSFLMIISKIIGGLGNQMFQYAAGKSLASANNCQLKLDISSFDTYALHNGYELGLFNIEAEIASAKEIAKLVNRRTAVFKKLFQSLKLSKHTHLTDRNCVFDPGFFDIRPPTYLEGYWQSYKYIEPFSTQILEAFTFKPPLLGQNLDLATQIKSCNSVSIHIRRGDYLSNPSFSRIHGFVGLNYYRLAMTKILEKTSAPVFFVFSDDVSWAIENLQLSRTVNCVSHNTGAQSYEDMRLMSLCNHNIIANSSFSWWAAWLNMHTNKIVICPTNWLADPLAVSNYQRFVEDLIPPAWLML